MYLLLCVVIACALCRMKKLIVRVKRVFPSSPYNRGSSSRSSDGSQDSAWSSSFVPSSHEIGGSIRYPAHDDVPMATDGDDISTHTTTEMEKYKSLHHRELAHTHVYDVNLLERVGLDEEPLTILRTISWGKLYDVPRLGSPSRAPV
jgi:hypothetical protein